MDLTARFLTDRADLSATAAYALNRVCREGPIRLTTLAAKEGISQPSMTQLIQRLERQGLVTRLADPEDGRATLVGITAQGQSAARRPEAPSPRTPRGVVGDPERRGAQRVVAFGASRRSGRVPACRRTRTARPRRSAEGGRVKAVPMGRGLKKLWIPLVLDRRAGDLGSGRVAPAQDVRLPGPQRQRRRRHRDRPVQSRRSWSTTSTAHPAAPPRSATSTRTRTCTRSPRRCRGRSPCRRRCPTVSANLMARTDGDQIGCRVTVNGTVREEQSADGVDAQTYCLVKSA